MFRCYLISAPPLTALWVPCIEKASESFGCEVGDYNCLCGFIDDLVGAAGTCVFGACSDPIAVLNAANAACACLAAVPETPPPTTTPEPETPPPTTTQEPETPTPTPPPFNGTPIECDPFAAKIPECAKVSTPSSLNGKFYFNSTRHASTTQQLKWDAANTTTVRIKFLLSIINQYLYLLANF